MPISIKACLKCFSCQLQFIYSDCSRVRTYLFFFFFFFLAGEAHPGGQHLMGSEWRDRHSSRYDRPGHLGTTGCQSSDIQDCSGGKDSEPSLYLFHPQLLSTCGLKYLDFFWVGGTAAFLYLMQAFASSCCPTKTDPQEQRLVFNNPSTLPRSEFRA